jgi:hypothetical protein
VLIGTGIAMALPGERAGMLNTGAHGLSEVLYAFTSAANNNGSAFAGSRVNTDLVQRRARAGHDRRPVPADGARALALAGFARATAGQVPVSSGHAADRTGRSSSACSSA